MAGCKVLWKTVSFLKAEVMPYASSCSDPLAHDREHWTGVCPYTNISHKDLHEQNELDYIN